MRLANLYYKAIFGIFERRAELNVENAAMVSIKFNNQSSNRTCTEDLEVREFCELAGRKLCSPYMIHND